MSDTAIISPRLLVGWIGAAVAIFAVSLYFTIQSGETKPGADAVGPSSFSRSAIGYAGAADLLQRLGVTVVKSQYDAAAKRGRGGVLVLAEPRFGPTLGEPSHGLFAAGTVLLILPKWHGVPSRAHAGWIDDAQLLPSAFAQWALAQIESGGKVARTDTDEEWATNRIGPSPPRIDAPIQLMQSDRLRPIIASGSGMLLGELNETGRRVWILSDPDVLNNHALAQEASAEFVAALFSALRQGNGAVVFDETIHGYVARPPSLWALLFRFPFGFATLQVALAALLLLWGTVGRFGAPEAAPAPLGAGKEALIDNASRLIASAGHQPVIVRRYVSALMRDAARQLHAPRGLSEGDLADWLQRVGMARGVSVDCAELQREIDREDFQAADTARLKRIARAIHQWKGEIIDGSSTNSRRHRGRADGGAEGHRRAG